MSFSGKGKMSNNLGKILKQRRVMVPLTLLELATASGVSASHLGRIERGERFPSARILRKIAKPLGFTEIELFSLADFLPSDSPNETENVSRAGRLDPYMAALLASEPVSTQRALVAILTILKGLAKAKE